MAGRSLGALDLAASQADFKSALRQWVFRGGRWNHNANHCRSANRNNNPGNRNNNIGFRVVLAPAQPESRVTLRLTRLPSGPRNTVSRGKAQRTKARCG